MSNRVRIVVILTVLVGVLFPLWSQSADELTRVDDLIEAEQPEEALAAAEALLMGTSGADRAEVLWRLSSATLMLGDQAKDNGAGDDELLAIYERGETYGEEAIQSDPANPLGYYWKSANIGRWGQTKGVLNSLFRAPDMRDLLTEAVTRDPNHAESYYVLGQLYAQVPGFSFGDVEYAVSLGRKSVDLMESELSSGEREEINEAFYVQLASHLIDRGWNERRRNRKVDEIQSRYREAQTPIERGFFYEGTANVPSVEDDEEAAAILDATIGRLEAKPSLTPGERRQLNEARELRGSM